MDEKAGIAELKSRLSHYLRAVRRGRSVTVYDRDQPVATLVPYTGTTRLVIRERAAGSPRPGDVPLMPPLMMCEDAVSFLLEERGEH